METLTLTGELILKMVINSILIVLEITVEDVAIVAQTTMLFGTGFIVMMGELSNCHLQHIK